MVLSYQRRVLIGFCVAMLLLCSVGLSVYTSFVEMNRQKARVDHTYQVIETLQDILSNLKDVQSSVRGYAITGTQNYLTPYFLSVPAAEAGVKKLETLISDNPAQMEHFIPLKEHVADRIAIAAEVIDLYKDKGQEAAFKMIRTGVGKSTMDELRVIIADMTNEERRLLDIRRTNVEYSAKMTMVAGGLGLATAMAILGAMFSLIRREAKRRERTESNLRDAFAQMELLNAETQLIARLGDYLRSCRTEEEAYEIIAKNMIVIFPETSGAVSLFKNSRNILQSVLSWGESSSMPTEFEPDTCWALRQGRVHHTTSDGNVPVCDHVGKDGESIVTVCMPMQAQGETIGQIYMAAHDAEFLNEHQIATLRTVGEQVSLALANLHLQKALKEQSIKDPLTKLFNRRYLEETMARECARAQRNQKKLSVLIMDIDHFKKVNDTYGHDAGDAVLVAFARLLSQKIRKEDIACRLGGEEFVLVLPDADLALAKARAEEICEATRKMVVKFQKLMINVTVSIGVCMYPDHGEVPEELIHHADLCLYKAKRDGRDRVIVYDDTIGEEKV